MAEQMKYVDFCNLKKMEIYALFAGQSNDKLAKLAMSSLATTCAY
jgi:hypothetical protein